MVLVFNEARLVMFHLFLRLLPCSVERLASKSGSGFPVKTRISMFRATNVIQQARGSGVLSPSVKNFVLKIFHSFHLVTQDCKLLGTLFYKISSHLV